MNFKESKEFNVIAEGTVEFYKETCCALYRAFKKNPELVEQLKGIVGKEKIKLFANILFNSLAPLKWPEMRFVPSEEMKTVYSQIAKRELERITTENEDDTDLSCEHTIDEHLTALGEVVKNMAPVIN